MINNEVSDIRHRALRDGVCEKLSMPDSFLFGYMFLRGCQQTKLAREGFWSKIKRNAMKILPLYPMGPQTLGIPRPRAPWGPKP